jgi:hypothetical protein
MEKTENTSVLASLEQQLRSLGPNAPCFCGSQKKFKKCHRSEMIQKANHHRSLQHLPGNVQENKEQLSELQNLATNDASMPEDQQARELIQTHQALFRKLAPDLQHKFSKAFSYIHAGDYVLAQRAIDYLAKRTHPVIVQSLTMMLTMRKLSDSDGVTVKDGKEHQYSLEELELYIKKAQADGTITPEKAKELLQVAKESSTEPPAQQVLTENTPEGTPKKESVFKKIWKKLSS